MNDHIPEGTKRCSRCKECKPFAEFWKNKGKPMGLRDQCKPCCSALGKIYYVKHDRKTKARNPKAYERRNAARRRRYREDPEYREQYLAKSRELRRTPEYKERNRDKVRARYRDNPSAKAGNNLMRRLRSDLKKIGMSKSHHSVELFGCSLEALGKHLESLWREGMSWDNYGFKGWHIDHIIPMQAFDLTDIEQQKACFHYTNLQPLWALENIAKGAKMPDGTDLRSPSWSKAKRLKDEQPPSS